MNHQDKRRLAKHVAKLLRQANVDPKQVGLDMKREFPEASLELDRELARLACVDMGATLMSHLQSKTDHDIASSPTLKFGFERAVHRYVQAELATLASHADQVVLLSQAYQDKGWTPMLNNPEWHKAIKTEFPSQLDAQRFLVGQIQGFTDSQIHNCMSLLKTVTTSQRSMCLIQKVGMLCPSCQYRLPVKCSLTPSRISRSDWPLLTKPPF
ncbi:hypothetical protein [Vibrio mediterranei]|uniref:hypothetical protein n=1 Tax=Vibrio mediterranei TaxID=689 RepID=UPI00148DE78E|nr:hypothetical protein [Vibrio mediterranei]NOH31643.1 hypothetical protein [Vibrio mediterranei]